jgi:hypothetical protein
MTKWIDDVEKRRNISMREEEIKLAWKDALLEEKNQSFRDASSI